MTIEYLGTEKKINAIKPLLSVCITAYQHENYISQCIESALSQNTNFPFEVLIGEDESLDETRSICMSYASEATDKLRLFLNNRKDVIYIDGKPTGRSNFLNLLSIARGKYIALLDGDDFWIDANKLQIQTDHLEKDPNISLTFHNVYLKTIDKPSELNRTYLTQNFFKNKIPDHLLLQQNYIPTSSVVFRNNIPKIFPKIFYKYPFGDWPLHIYNLNYGRIRYIDKVMGVYRLGSGTWTKKTAVTQMHAILAFYDDIREVLPKDMLRFAPLALSKNHFKTAFLYSRQIKFCPFAVHFFYGIRQLMLWASQKR